MGGESIRGRCEPGILGESIRKSLNSPNVETREELKDNRTTKEKLEYLKSVVTDLANRSKKIKYRIREEHQQERIDTLIKTVMLILENSMAAEADIPKGYRDIVSNPKSEKSFIETCEGIVSSILQYDNVYYQVEKDEEALEFVMKHCKGSVKDKVNFYNTIRLTQSLVTASDALGTIALTRYYK